MKTKTQDVPKNPCPYCENVIKSTESRVTVDGGLFHKTCAQALMREEGFAEAVARDYDPQV
jgi:hypothetical protein